MSFKLQEAAVLLLGCVAFGATGITGHRNRQPVEVTVFYQPSLASYNFFTNELYPTYLYVNGYNQQHKQKLIVTLMPYTTLNCSLETSESNQLSCHDIKLQACAASNGLPTNLPSDWNRLNFVSCSMKNPQNFYNFKRNEECALATCIDSTKIAFCLNSVDGDAILAANFAKFKKLNVNARDEPVIMFNNGLGEGTVLIEDEDKGLNNFMALLCSKVPNYFDGCTSLPRVKSEKQFSFTNNEAFSIKRRCNIDVVNSF